MRVRGLVVWEVPDDADLDQLRTWLEETAGDVEDATVVATDLAGLDVPYRVVGTTRGKPDETWEAVVYAQDPDEAKALAAREDKTRAVADVQALSNAVEVQAEPDPASVPGPLDTLPT